ncbi:DUF3365 domain-containing protein, partial [Pelagibius litoralis]
AFLISGGSAVAQDLSAYTDEARAAIQQLRQVMMEHLQQAVREVGPAEATSVCRHLAPEIAAEVAAETGWEIRRPALRARNPENRPNEAERGVLLGYLTRSFAGQSFDSMETIRLEERDGRTYVHYMRAVPTLDACLVCHGSDLRPDVARKIEEVYPEDEAVDFAVGDLRGAFSLMKPYDPKEAPDLRPSPLPEPAVLPSAVPLGIPGRTGDAGKGRALFGRHCLSCHAARDLAAFLYPSKAESPRDDVCVFLQTHGLTDEARDCDIVAYLKILAQQPTE